MLRSEILFSHVLPWSSLQLVSKAFAVPLRFEKIEQNSCEL